MLGKHATDMAHAQMKRDLVIDIHRLERKTAAAICAGQRIDGLHVVQPIGKLDENASHVESHDVEEFAERLNLAVERKIGAQIGLRKFGDSFDKKSHPASEFEGDFVSLNGRIFDDVVEQCGDNRVSISLPTGENFSDFDDVKDVRTPIFALLRRMCCNSEIESLTHLGEITRVEVRKEGRQGTKIGLLHWTGV